MINPTEILNRYGQLKSRRDGLYLPVWREVRRYVYPNYSDYLPEGGERGVELFDDTAIKARQILAAGMYNWMAPPDKRWFELKPSDDDLEKNADVKEFFSELTTRIAYAMANSNWPSVLIQALNNLACGLDAIIWIEDGGAEATLNFRCFPPESVVYAENRFGIVDTVFREYSQSARLLVAEFGADKVSEKIRAAAAKPESCDQEFKILHAVFPRQQRDDRMKDNLNMPFADCYIDLAAKTLIEEGGFQEFPFAVCRFEKVENETYGRGPGMNKLPTIRMVNRMEEALSLGVEFAADPGWLVPDGSLLDQTFDRDPGAINVYKPTLNGSKPEPIRREFNVSLLDGYMEQKRKEIRNGFFNDIFDPLGDLKNITATEAEMRQESKIAPFAPIAGNVHNELFRVVIHRSLGIMARKGDLPAAPAILGEYPDYKVDFVSKIALSIKKLEALGWLQTEAALAGTFNLDPSVADNFVYDQVARDVAMVNGAPQRWLRPERERDQIRAARAEQQEAMQQLQAMGEAAAAAPNLAQAPEPGSPLDSLINQGGI